MYRSREGLEEKGWAEAKSIKQGGWLNRKEYAITAAGHAELLVGDIMDRKGIGRRSCHRKNLVWAISV
jgi:DNA-binding PadR family transcriptional regulator